MGGPTVVLLFRYVEEMRQKSQEAMCVGPTERGVYALFSGSPKHEKLVAKAQEEFIELWEARRNIGEFSGEGEIPAELAEDARLLVFAQAFANVAFKLGLDIGRLDRGFAHSGTFDAENQRYVDEVISEIANQPSKAAAIREVLKKHGRPDRDFEWLEKAVRRHQKRTE